MKIGITCYPSEGGSGVVATELGKELARRGHEIHFITSSLPIRLRRFEKNICFHEVRPENYPVFHYPPYSLSLAAKMAEVTKAYDLDILHAHYAMPHAASAYLAKQMLGDTKVKTVTTLHGTDITLVGQAPSFHMVTRFSIAQSDCVTSVSEWLKQETIRIFDPKRPIQVIPNFVDAEIFKPRDLGSRREQFAAPEEKLLMHVSNFRPVKNIKAVINTFAEVRKRTGARLVMVGDGPERTPVEQLVRSLDLSDHVTFLGNQEYIEDLLPVADVFLLPSLHESFGLVVLEAMAAGVPVVATDVGGPREVVVDGESGFLRSPHDVPGMVEAVMRILGDRTLAGSVSREAVKRARTEFTLERIIPQYEAAYESCHC